jgi:hypothetical protein
MQFSRFQHTVVLLLWMGLMCSFAKQNHAQISGQARQQWIYAQKDTLKVQGDYPFGAELKVLSATMSPENYELIPNLPGVYFPNFQGEVDSLLIQISAIQLPPLEFSHKDTSLFRPTGSSEFKPYILQTAGRFEEDEQSALNKSGSLSRGLVFGNNQNLSVNAALNLQLSGFITDDIQILASVTDDNLPIQPDGNTSQLQDFDQVYVKLFNESSSLVAGDFQIAERDDHFVRFQKRSRGANFETAWDQYQVQASMAVSKGKFARNVIQGIEGNQGPYRLTGDENELFIVVLAGTERVFIDGQLLQRGRDYDYVIDYNAAEITFMPTKRITKDRRITVEFQYSDKNYARTMLQSKVSGEEDKWSWTIHAYSEQDSKNQPLQQTLETADKNVLRDAGDEVFNALRNSIDSVGFSEGQVLYMLVDSLGYDSVLVRSDNPELAQYTARFAFVGAGVGNYIEDGFTANGRSFAWAAPDTLDDGSIVLNGTHEPVRLLIAPKRRQMASGVLRYAYRKDSYIQSGLALSRNDQNTFSSLDKEDDNGIGIYTEWKHQISLDSSSVQVRASHEYVSQFFSPIERFRAVEFDRNWNTLGVDLNTDQHLGEVSLEWQKGKNKELRIGGETFQAGALFGGYRANGALKWQDEKYLLQYNGSFTSTEKQINSSFYRHKSVAQKNLGKLVFRYQDEFEFNERRQEVLSGYQFHEWQGSVGNQEEGSPLAWKVFYGQRTDELPDSLTLTRIARAEEYGARIGFNNNGAQSVQLSVSQRNLKIVRSDLSNIEPDETLLGRLEHRLNLARGAISSNLFYELGSGLEQRREFIYLEVPPGQGAYVWNDYDGDGVRDLDEFEIATFAYEANYIRSWVPSNQYSRTFSNQFSETLLIQPARIWSNEKGWKGSLAKWSNNAAYRVERKTSNENELSRFNPFEQNIADSSLITLQSSFRNALAYNRSSSVFSADYTYQDQRNKNLLSNGFESRSDRFHEVGARWTLSKGVTGLLRNRIGQKRALSDFVSGRNYFIRYQEIAPELQWQPNTTQRVSVKGRYVVKNNEDELGGQAAEILDLGVEAKWSDPSKGLLQADFHWVEITYDGENNNALAFEMLEALQVGRNFTWSASIQRTVGKNLQLNLVYNGRKSASTPSIHTGGVQLRAFF